VAARAKARRKWADGGMTTEKTKEGCVVPEALPLSSFYRVYSPSFSLFHSRK